MDIRDLWRSDEDGPHLTWRQVWVYVRHLPRDSALAIDDNKGTQPWSMEEHLLADIWVAQVRATAPKNKRPKDHPAREAMKKRQIAGRATRKRGAYERVKARNAQRLKRATS
ncbi:hypothetical protein [Rhodococcus globerulus]|uniref:Transposase n=1 Tax=Rhodococcus globerulus TaxID=33008 RepID=A0ABU4BS87_RHOGO|nr:hypothetical protein [Rhodococcus globerulus]MDV6267080.1 hypothetical protein [Rhodococcus globerulus]